MRMLDSSRMKEFKVILRDGRSEVVEAEMYRREGEQYVFDKELSAEVQFFNADDVIGIKEENRTTDPKTPRAPFLSEFLS
jgi:hypothetical protein